MGIMTVDFALVDQQFVTIRQAIPVVAPHIPRCGNHEAEQRRFWAPISRSTHSTFLELSPRDNRDTLHQIVVFA